MITHFLQCQRRCSVSVCPLQFLTTNCGGFVTKKIVKLLFYYIQKPGKQCIFTIHVHRESREKVSLIALKRITHVDPYNVNQE